MRHLVLASGLALVSSLTLIAATDAAQADIFDLFRPDAPQGPESAATRRLTRQQQQIAARQHRLQAKLQARLQAREAAGLAAHPAAPSFDLFSGLFGSSPAPAQTTAAPTDGADRLGRPLTIVAAGVQSGLASFYSSRHTTSNGGHVGAYTCAHRSLPMGTQVRVTNLRNQRSVVLTVNDRGPFVAHRIVDVSRPAATALGFASAGVAPVAVEVVGRIAMADVPAVTQGGRPIGRPIYPHRTYGSYGSWHSRWQAASTRI